MRIRAEYLPLRFKIVDMKQPLIYKNCSPAVSTTLFSHLVSLKASIYKAYGALIENEQRTRQAVRGIKEMFRKDGVGPVNAKKETLEK